MKRAKRITCVWTFALVAMATFAFTTAAANAAIMVDNSDSVAVNNTSPITINDFAIGSNSNRLLIVTIGNELAGDNIASVTFGGVAMVLQTKNVSNRATFIYSLANPTVGTTDDIVVTWGAGAGSTRYDSLVAAMSLYGDNALAIVETFSGTTDDNPVFANFDQATEAFFYAGVNSVNGGGANASPTFDALPPDYDSGNAVLDSHSSRARGHYFSSGTGGDSLAVTADESSSRIAIQEPTVQLSDDSVATNVPPGTLVGVLSDPTDSADEFEMATGAGDTDNAKFEITNTNELRTTVWMSQSSNSVLIAAISDGTALVTNSIPIYVTAPVRSAFIVSAEVANPPLDGDIVGLMKAANEGATFTMVGGREDLFTQDASSNLLVTNSANWGVLGSTNYVTLRAVTSTDTIDLVVGVEVISTTPTGTLFMFR